MLILITAYTISFVPALFVAEDGREQKNTCVKPIICVGVFTDGGGVPRYADRRAALRATWFPSTPGALKDVECTYGITVRFVVGNGELTNDTIAIRAYHAELKEHGDFFRLDVLDTYPAMTGKTSKMFRQVLSLPEEYQYAIKIDDDMYVSLAHLSKAAEQWTAMGVDYVGCMNHPGIIYKTEGESIQVFIFVYAHLGPFMTYVNLSQNQTKQARSGTSHSTTYSRQICTCTLAVPRTRFRERR